MHEARALILRYVLYTVGLLLALSSLTWLAKTYGISAFREGQIVETIELSITSTTGLMLLVAATRLPQWRQLLVALGMLAMFAAVRECDQLLRHMLPLGWKGPAVLVVMAGVYYARDVDALVRQLARLMTSPAIGILWAGLFIVVGCAQLIGHGPLHNAVAANEYDAGLKRVIEESLETAGYMVIFIGSLELLFSIRRIE